LNDETYVQDDQHVRPPATTLIDVVQFSAVIVRQPLADVDDHVVGADGALELAPKNASAVVGGAMQPPTPIYPACLIVFTKTVAVDEVSSPGYVPIDDWFAIF